MATQTREASSSSNKEQQQKDSAEKSARSVFGKKDLVILEVYFP